MIIPMARENSPELKKPVNFFLLSSAGLITTALFCISQYASLTSRWEISSITLTHLFTLTFLLPVIMGALTQMSPVLFGIEINFKKVLDPLFTILPIGAFLFLTSFYNRSSYFTQLMIIGVLLLWAGLMRLIFSVLKECFKKIKTEKSPLHLKLFLSFFHFFIALLLSILLIAAHSGINVPDFRPRLTNLHLLFMFAGFLFNLVFAITSRFIPMFYMTKEMSSKRSLTINVLTNLPLILKLFVKEDSHWNLLLDSLLGSGLILFAGTLFVSLKNRKRKLPDPIIFLWQLFCANLILGTLLTLLMNHSEPDEFWKLRGGAFLITGIILPLVSAMLMKIIPFLHWLHLNNQNSLLKQPKIIPHMKEFISDDKVKALVVLILLLNLSLLIPGSIPGFLLSGIILLMIGLFFCYFLLNAQKIYLIHFQDMKADQLS